MRNHLNRVPFLFFIISGACGLVYEVTWARYLALFLGHTTLAHMCVLAAFMGGLALGSIFIGRMTAGFRRPLAAYGILELVIGLYALASPAIIHAAQSAMIAAGSGLQPGTPALLAYKLLVSIVVLLLPTVLMGGTFPILMEYYRPRSESAEDKSEWLYLLNCGGAVLGSLIAGFALIPAFGLRSTLTGVGLLNGLLGACAVAVAYAVASDSPSPKSHADTRASHRHELAMPVYIAIAVSGMASMVYELVWIRVFAVTLGSSTYSFTLMLSAFITGISLGSLAVGLIARLRRHPLVSFALAEIAIALTVVLGLPLYERLPYIFWRWASLLSRTPEAYGLFNLMKYSLCFAVMAVPTLFFGMTLPLAIKSIARRDERIGMDSGFVYGANTLGTLFGALIAGLFLMRTLGLRHSLEAALVVNALAGILLLSVSSLARKTAVSIATCIVLVGLIVAMPKWHPVNLSVGTFRFTTSAPATWADYEKLSLQIEVLFHREDDDGIVSITRSGAGPDISLQINGKADASSYSDLPTQVLLGQLPLFLKPDARDVLVVGLGSGVTAHSVLTHPDTRVDCVEISPAVVEASRFFASVNGRVYENKRFNLICEDGRSYVSMTRRKYDVVSSEPSNPWIAGIGNLFSREFYQGVDRVLNPGGLLVQWVQRYEISDDLVRTIIRTMSEVFPYVYVFESNESDFVMIASRDPLSPDLAAMRRLMRIPSVRADLARISTDSLAALLGRQTLCPDAASALAGGDASINSDDRPVLEFAAPKAQFLGRTCEQFDAADQRLTRGGELLIRSYLRGGPIAREDLMSLLKVYADPRVKNARLSYLLTRYAMSKWPDTRVTRLYAMLAQDMDSSVARQAIMGLGASSDPKTLRAQADILSRDLMSAHSVFTPQDFTPALLLIDKAMAASPQNASLQSLKDQLLALSR